MAQRPGGVLGNTGGGSESDNGCHTGQSSERSTVAQQEYSPFMHGGSKNLDYFYCHESSVGIYYRYQHNVYWNESIIVHLVQSPHLWKNV